jgi:hypothetical protein
MTAHRRVKAPSLFKHYTSASAYAQQRLVAPLLNLTGCDENGPAAPSQQLSRTLRIPDHRVGRLSSPCIHAQHHSSNIPPLCVCRGRLGSHLRRCCPLCRISQEFVRTLDSATHPRVYQDSERPVRRGFDPMRITSDRLSICVLTAKAPLERGDGLFHRIECTRSLSGWASFEALQVLKGDASLANRAIQLCNSPPPMREYPDPTRWMAREFVLFLSAEKEGCFEYSHTTTSVVGVHDGKVTTAAIADQPIYQPWDIFLKKLRKLMAKQGP